MPDYTMCEDNACPMMRTCARNAASGVVPRKDEQGRVTQAYFGRSPRVRDECNYFESTQDVKPLNPMEWPKE